MSEANWVPEILYEESEEGSSSNIPFVMVPEGEDMPHLLYIFESRETGDLEPNLSGDPVPVVEWDLHQYADMLKLKTGLSEEDFDKVRACLGLEKLVDASRSGSRITERVRENFVEQN